MAAKLMASLELRSHSKCETEDGNSGVMAFACFPHSQSHHLIELSFYHIWGHKTGLVKKTLS